MASEDLEFNLSHSGNFIAIAFARGHSVGVDIELVRPMDDLEEIARQHFSDVEFAELSQLPQARRVKEFFKKWVQKEAIAKGIGLGLLLPLNQIFLPNSKSPAKKAALEGLPNGENQCWNLADLELPCDYVGAVAFDKSPASVFHKHFSHSVLPLAEAGIFRGS
jgi:4'-phosphopantetheinyl transferase